MDRKTVLAIVVIGLIIVLTPYYYKWVAPPPPKDAPATTQQADSSAAPETGKTADTVKTTAAAAAAQATQTATPAPVTEQESGSKEWFSPDPPQDAKPVVVETPLYTATFSTRGATIHSWILKPKQSYLKTPEQLVRKQFAERNLVFTARGGRGLLRTEEKNFTVDRDSLVLTKADSSGTIVFSLDLGDKGYYREIYTFHPDSYEFGLRIESKGISDLTGAATASFGWGGGMAYTEKDTAQDMANTTSYYLMGKDKEQFKGNGHKADEEEATGPTSWVAQRIKYFLVAIVPKEPADGARMDIVPDTLYQGKYPPRLYDTELVFKIPGDTFDRQMSIYIGPLEQKLITAVDPSLEETMSWSIWGLKLIEPFSKGTYWVLVWAHKFIPNYGVVLILFAIAVKLLVWPLTHKSYQSMKRMQVIQPMVKAIQEKYKEKPNPQKMQQEIMALYKENKVNPMGGCWPTLLQMPLLYGLFIVFRTTIELRGQPFVLWINDLSMPDSLVTFPFHIPLYGNHLAVLPLVMAGSTFLQSRQTASKDPNQRMMLYLMPIMFIFLFNNFPSGLTLYYTLFNLLSWAQQKMMKVHDPKLEQKLVEVEKEHERAVARAERKQRKAKKN